MKKIKSKPNKKKDMARNRNVMRRTYFITGTYHGSVVYTNSEAHARKVFADYWNGEEIIEIHYRDGLIYP